ncbi:MAG: tRNA (adenosine(37)-N6)-threonylcarbamoyltransferase complex ATPase subunit type 1 TsaE [Flavobacteriales bacterium]|jgi:tRNA threonylcarbamoyladenosine biosynthesis protein TsaE|nr:tRNA (adenosine(37)-N6)-threonylcarbamoyltransferase complex ATPase subunit type 1 TsaE [Flavobacteriales bacterium]
MSKNTIYPCNELKDLQSITQQIIHSHPKNIILLKGDLGAGKTTFIKEFCECKKVIDKVTSPSFSIVNEYLTETNTKIYHFDFYRLEDENEAWDIGIEEYFESGNICLIEWPEKIPSLLPKDHSIIEIKKTGENRRAYCVTI